MISDDDYENVSTFDSATEDVQLLESAANNTNEDSAVNDIGSLSSNQEDTSSKGSSTDTYTDLEQQEGLKMNAKIMNNLQSQYEPNERNENNQVPSYDKQNSDQDMTDLARKEDTSFGYEIGRENGNDNINANDTLDNDVANTLGEPKAYDSWTENTVSGNAVEDRPRIILRIKASTDANRKRRPRKSIEPKRIVPNKDSDTPSNEGMEVQWNQKNQYLSSIVNHIGNDVIDDGIIDSPGKTQNENEYSNFELTVESIAPATSPERKQGQDQNQNDILTKIKKPSRKRKPKAPNAHGIDFPEPVLIESQTGEEPVLMLPCELCHKKCKNKSSYIAHYKSCASNNTSSGKVKHECKICGRLYELKSSLHKHMKIHLGLVEFKCQLCEKHFSDAKSLRGHILIHTGEKPYECKFCGFKFRDKSTLYKHETRHGTEKPFRCDVCLKDFFLGVDLRKHQKIHSKNKEFKCDQCDKQFYLKAQLTRHNQVHTGERPYGCQLCGKCFSDKTSLKGHIASHTGIKPFQCEFFGATFIWQCRNDSHVKLHNNERPYECETWGRVKLKVYFCHTGIKPFQCDLCGATFIWQCRLDSHLKRHNNERPFECETCGRKFIQNSDLTHHRKSHSGERNYVCPTCGKTFAESGSLWKHKKIHTGVRNHICSFCGKAYGSMFVLKRHWSTCKRKRSIENDEVVGHTTADGKGDAEKSIDESEDDPLLAGEPTSNGSDITKKRARKGDLNADRGDEIEVLINEPPEIRLKSFLID